MHIGDIVERGDRPKTRARGRVTGFAPNGWVRVRLDIGQTRIWPQDKLKIIEDFIRKQAQEAVRRWVEEVGEDRVLAIMNKVWPKTHEGRTR